MTGIIHDQSNADYHANPALGSTYIKDWALRSPLHAERGEKTINPFIADEGTAAHLVFEGKPELVIDVTDEKVLKYNRAFVLGYSLFSKLLDTSTPQNPVALPK